MRWIFTLALLLPMLCYAQNDGQGIMASNQKYYVVAGVLAIIFIGIAAFLLYLDRRLKRLEDQQND